MFAYLEKQESLPMIALLVTTYMVTYASAIIGLAIFLGAFDFLIK